MNAAEAPEAFGDSIISSRPYKGLNAKKLFEILSGHSQSRVVEEEGTGSALYEERW